MNCLSITTKKEHSISFLKTIFLQQIFTVTFIIRFYHGMGMPCVHPSYLTVLNIAINRSLAKIA